MTIFSNAEGNTIAYHETLGFVDFGKVRPYALKERIEYIRTFQPCARKALLDSLPDLTDRQYNFLMELPCNFFATFCTWYRALYVYLCMALFVYLCTELLIYFCININAFASMLLEVTPGALVVVTVASLLLAIATSDSKTFGEGDEKWDDNWDLG